MFQLAITAERFGTLPYAIYEANTGILLNPEERTALNTAASGSLNMRDRAQGNYQEALNEYYKSKKKGGSVPVEGEDLKDLHDILKKGRKERRKKHGRPEG